MGGIQPAVCAVNDHSPGQNDAALGLEIVDDELMAFPLRLVFLGLLHVWDGLCQQSRGTTYQHHQATHSFDHACSHPSFLLRKAVTDTQPWFTSTYAFGDSDNPELFLRKHYRARTLIDFGRAAPFVVIKSLRCAGPGR